MPQHEFLCQDCKRPFSKILTAAEYEEGSITCPHCGSRTVEQQASLSYAVTSASEENDRARVLSDWEAEGGASGAKKAESVEQELGKSVKK